MARALPTLLLATLMLAAPIVAGEGYDALPAAKEGKFPVHLPTYDGVEQLLLLSNRWVIVATTDLDDVVKQIDKLSGGALSKALDDWEKIIRASREWNRLKRIKVHTIGIGGHNVAFMSRLASENGGTYVAR